MLCFGSKTKKPRSPADTIGAELAAVLPQNQGPWWKTKHLLILNLLLVVPLLSGSSVGYDGSMMNGLQTLPQWRDYFNRPDAPLLGNINAVYPVGKLIGIFPTAWLGDRYGRRVPIIVGLILLIAMAAFQAGAQNVGWFIASRFLTGMGTAFVAQPSPILITELAYPTHRGKATALLNTPYYLGAILAAWSTYATFKMQNTWSWRIPSALQALYPVIQLSLIWFVPESPRWLISKGRAEEACPILVKHHAGGDESSPLVEMEMKEMEEAIRLEAALVSQSSYLDLVRGAPNRRRTLIAVIVGFFAQWNGIGVVSYYLTLVLNTIGVTTVKEQALINGLLQVFNFAAAVFGGALMVDRLGRRTLFLLSCSGLLLSYACWTALVTTLTAQFVITKNSELGNAVVAFIFIAYFFYDIAWTPLVYSYPVEIFPFALRSRGFAVTLSSTYIGLISGQLINPVALKAIGWKYYIVFCVILACLTTTVHFLFPETKGRNLEEIAEIFDGKKLNIGEQDGTKDEEANINEKPQVVSVERVST